MKWNDITAQRILVSIFEMLLLTLAEVRTRDSGAIWAFTVLGCTHHGTNGSRSRRKVRRDPWERESLPCRQDSQKRN